MLPGGSPHVGPRYGQPQKGGRRGLAPLELVLVLPLLAMIGGLLMFVAYAGVWKQRVHVASREAVWQTAWPQTDDVQRRPEWGRADVTQRTEIGSPVWGWDPFEDHPLFRGPQTMTQSPLAVNAQYLNGLGGRTIGIARSEIRSRIWPRLRVTYRFQRDQPLLGRELWQYDAMQLPHHGARRSVALFQLD